MPKIINKNSSDKSKCSHDGTCKQYKKYRELLERYADWCSDKITKRDVKLVKLFEKPKAPIPLEEGIKLLELENERLKAILLFYSIENNKSKGKLKEILRKKIRRINLKARKIIVSLDINCRWES